MTSRRSLLRAPAAAAFSAVLLASALTPVVAQGPRPAYLAGGRAQIARHAETGLVRFKSAVGGGPVARATDSTRRLSAPAAARAYLTSAGADFGVTDPDRQLQLMGTTTSPNGRRVVRLAQVRDGVPVLGGQLVVRLDGERDVISVNGEIAPGVAAVSTRPGLSAFDAAAIATGFVTRRYGARHGRLTASAPTLAIHDAAIFGGPGPRIPRLVWRTQVTSAGGDVDEFVLVDAQHGGVLVNFSNVEHVTNIVCDAGSTATHVPCTTSNDVPDPAGSSVKDVQKAFKYANATHQFYLQRFGRNSLDDAGLTLRSTTRFCPNPGDCPFVNAFWNGSQMVYGEKLARADDVVGHEFTHGVTQFTSNLFYYYQSGAINEAMSDIMGEFIDQDDFETGPAFNGGDGNLANKWLIGEDIPTSVLPGALRNMKDPHSPPIGPTEAQPDRMQDAFYTADEGEGDGGGVHTNSGVANKADYLMTDGDTFNSQTVSGIGKDKAAAVWYEVETSYLHSASDYADLGTYLDAACTDLIGTTPRNKNGAPSGSGAFTAADCSNGVHKAVLATEMLLPPTTLGANPPTPAAICPVGTNIDVFKDKFGGDGSKWETVTADPPSGWYYATNPFDQVYATSGSKELWGDDSGTQATTNANISDSSFQMADAVVVPTDGYAHFNHAWGFDDDGGVFYDGGIVQYKAGTGAWTDVPLPWYTNGPNGVLIGTSGDPLGGKTAFVAESAGYTATRIDLTTLAGQSVKLRFRKGTDNSFGDYGWFIDDFRIYSCNS